MSDSHTRDILTDCHLAVPEVEQELLEAAREGRLAEFVATRSECGMAALFGFVEGVVYQNLSRPRELNRGHCRCAIRASRMDPECHDQHQDEVVAAFEYVLAYVREHEGERIKNLGGWLTSRLNFISIDAYRRRRVEVGAQARPRLPKWLIAELGADPWSMRLALGILDWVGVPMTAGSQVWPLAAWAALRAQTLGGPELSEPAMLAEVDQVIAAMRVRPKWHEKYVERPLGRKQAALASAHGTRADDDRDFICPSGPDAAIEASLTELAATAIEAIAALTSEGAPVRETVADVLGRLFGADEVLPEVDMAPDDGQSPDSRELAVRLILDPEVLDRVVDAVVRIMAEKPSR